jgi:hypothetical protein
MQQSIFKCASAPSSLRDDDDKNVIVSECARITKSKLITCFCFPSTEQNKSVILQTPEKSSLFNCRLLSFTVVLMQEVTEKLFTEQVSHRIHLKAAEFLESKKWKCRACGGDNLVNKFLNKHKKKIRIKIIFLHQRYLD